MCSWEDKLGLFKPYSRLSSIVFSIYEDPNKHFYNNWKVRLCASLHKYELHDQTLKIWGARTFFNFSVVTLTHSLSFQSSFPLVTAENHVAAHVVQGIALHICTSLFYLTQQTIGLNPTHPTEPTDLGLSILSEENIPSCQVAVDHVLRFQVRHATTRVTERIIIIGIGVSWWNS